MFALTYREKTLYAALFAELIVYIPYFIHEIWKTGFAAHSLVGTVVVGMAVLIALEIVVAITTRNQRTDERDLGINLRSYRVAYYGLIFSLVVVFGWMGAKNYLTAGAIADGLLASIFMAYTVQVVTQLVMYRRLD